MVHFGQLTDKKKWKSFKEFVFNEFNKMANEKKYINDVISYDFKNRRLIKKLNRIFEI